MSGTLKIQVNADIAAILATKVDKGGNETDTGQTLRDDINLNVDAIAALQGLCLVENAATNSLSLVDANDTILCTAELDWLANNKLTLSLSGNRLSLKDGTTELGYADFSISNIQNLQSELTRIEAIAKETGTSGSPTEFISIVTNWQGSGLDYEPYAEWKHNDVFKSFSGARTASPGDPVYGRFDSWIIDLATNSVELLQGTPAENPERPTLTDPANQLETGAFIFIPSGATEPGSVTGEAVYAEGLAGEWALSGTATYNATYTDTPHSGTVNLLVSFSQSGQNIIFTPTQSQTTQDKEWTYWIKNITGGSHYLLFTGTLAKNGRPGSVAVNAPANYSSTSILWQAQSVPFPTELSDVTSVSLVGTLVGLQIQLDDVRIITGGGAVVVQGVSKEYVDQQDAAVLAAAKKYHDDNVVLPEVTQQEFDDALALKVDKVAGMGLSEESFTTVEKTKLATLDKYYLGTHLSLTALETAHPTAIAGAYAYVDGGVGIDAIKHIWDSDDSKWIESGGTGGIDEVAVEALVRDTPRQYTKQQNFAQVTLIDASTLAWDLESAQVAILTATDTVGALRTIPNTVLTDLDAEGQSKAKNGAEYKLTFVQDAAGNRDIFFESNFVLRAGIVDPTPNSRSIITLSVQDGTAQVFILGEEAETAPSIQNRYLTITELINNQINQTDQFVQYVADASEDPTVDNGFAYYEKLGTSTGLLADYRKLSEQEGLDSETGAPESSIEQINAGTDNTTHTTPSGLQGSKYVTQQGIKTYAVASGTNTYIAALSPVITTLVEGMEIKIRFVNSNTGISTLNLNGLGVKEIQINGNVAKPGDVFGIKILVYDGVSWQLQKTALPDEPNRLVSTDSSGKFEAVHEITGLYLPPIDDTAGIRTSAQMNTDYPQAEEGHRVRGSAGVYENFGLYGWGYSSFTLV